MREAKMATMGRPVEWTRTNIIEALVGFYRATNAWPTSPDFFRDDLPHRNTVTRLFGSLATAITKAQEEISGDVTQHTACAMIVDYYRHTGIWPPVDAFGTESALPSKAVVHRLFGSVREALVAADRELDTSAQEMSVVAVPLTPPEAPGQDGTTFEREAATHEKVVSLQEKDSLAVSPPLQNGEGANTKDEEAKEERATLRAMADVLDTPPPGKDTAHADSAAILVAHCGGWHPVRAMSFNDYAVEYHKTLVAKAEALRAHLDTTKCQLIQVILQRDTLETYLETTQMTNEEVRQALRDVPELLDNDAPENQPRAGDGDA